MLLPMSTPSRSPNAVCFVVCFALAGTVSPAQQQPSGPPSERMPGLIVDFMAVSSDGTPVTGLTPEDVTVRIDGRTRTLRSLQLTRVAESGPADAPPPAALPLPYGTNNEGALRPGRRIVLAIDDDSFRAGTEAPLRQAIGGLLDGLAQKDRVLLVTMPYGGVKVPFTTDHTKIRVALASFAGQRPQAETGSEMACRTRRLLESLSGFLESSGASASPTTVVFFTSGLAGPRRDAPMALAPGMCELTVDQFRRVGTSAGSARATFYVVQPDDVSLRSGGDSALGGVSPLGSDNPLEGIEHLAGVTQGHRLPLNAAGGTALGRVLRETSAYYAAELVPERSDLNGRSHALSIKVKRPEIIVRARPEITFASARPAQPRTTPVTAHQMLVVSDVFTDLPLRVAGFTAQGVEGKLKVMAVAEPVESSVLLATATAALVDANGRVVAQWSARDAAEIPVAGAMLAEPGTYRLRVAATDSSGRGGTADYELTAQLTSAGPLTLSSLVLGLSRDGDVIPKLEFGSEPAVLGSFEIYGGVAGTRVASGLELARSVDGPAILTVPLAIDRAGEDRFIATGALPIGALPPGDYVVRGTIGVEGKAAGQVVRTLRKR
jgi:VWFA-related protein